MQNTAYFRFLFSVSVLYFLTAFQSQAAPKLYFYPDSTREVNTTLGVAPGYLHSFLMTYTYLPGKNISVTLIRGQRPVTTHLTFTPDKNGRSVLNLSAMMSKAQEGDRLVISYSVYNIVIPITEKAKNVTPR